VLIEVAAESVEDAVAAEQGGADRIELCAALDLGGLTPSVGAYLEVRAAVGLPIVVMIRPRPGDFVYSADELRVMVRDLETYLPHQPDGFVFGALAPDGRIDVEAVVSLVAWAGGRPCVFHRAFDRVPQAGEALDQLIAARFARVLTSGREATALAGAGEIARLVKRAAGRIEVLPCGRIRAKDAADVVRLTGCDQVHGSFARPLQLPDERGRRGYPERSATSRDEVAATRAALDALALGCE
jgi:copper homeostasis protein